MGKLTSFRHQNDNGPDVNKLSFLIWFESSNDFSRHQNDIINMTSKGHYFLDIKMTSFLGTLNDIIYYIKIKFSMTSKPEVI